jgi:hypothetical protein
MGMCLSLTLTSSLSAHTSLLHSRLSCMAPFSRSFLSLTFSFLSLSFTRKAQAVVSLCLNPNDDAQILIGYAEGQIIMWDFLKTIQVNSFSLRATRLRLDTQTAKSGFGPCEQAISSCGLLVRPSASLPPASSYCCRSHTPHSFSLWRLVFALFAFSFVSALPSFFFSILSYPRLWKAFTCDQNFYQSGWIHSWVWI